MCVYLHDNVEGEVQQQVTDGNGQQVRSKVIWLFNETVCSPAHTSKHTAIYITLHGELSRLFWCVCVCIYLQRPVHDVAHHK